MTDKPAPRRSKARKPTDPSVEVALPETAIMAPAIASDMPATAPAEADSVTKDEAMTETVETMTTKARTQFADMNDRAKGAMEKGTKMLSEVNDMSKGNLEAMVESSKIAAKGVEAMGQHAASFAKAQFEATTQAMKTLATAKSPTEFMQLQADFARSAFDRYVAEASRSTEAMMKLAGDVAQPISNRWALAAEKMKVAAA